MDNGLFSGWEVAFIFALFLTAVLVGGHFLIKLFKFLVAPILRVKTAEVKSSTLNRQMTGISRSALVEQFISSEGIERVKIRHIAGRLVTEKLSDRLREYFSFEVHTELCSYKKDSCITYFRLVGRTGKIFMLAMADAVYSATWADGTPVYEFKFNEYEQLQNFYERNGDNNRIRLSYECEVIFSSLYDDNCEDLQILVDTIKDSLVQDIVYEAEPEEEQVKIFDLIYQEQVGYQLVSSYTEVVRLQEKLNKIYAPVSVKYRGEEKQIRANKAVDLAVLGLATNRNLYIWGPPGTGKTSLSQQIIAELQDDYSNVAVIRMTPSILGELQSAASQYQFIQQIKVLGADRIIIRIDEAESLLRASSDGIHSEITSFMLSILDGELRETLNCNTILVFNAPKEKLNSALFRSGRPGLEFNLTPLPKKQALEAVEYFRETLDGFLFDTATFERFINEDSKLPNGEVYAKKDEITLADIVRGCFLRKEENDLLIDAIREMYSIDEELKIPEKSVILPPTVVRKNPVVAKLVRLPNIPGEGNISSERTNKKFKGYYHKKKNR